MELNSLALEACISDKDTYFGRIPRDIVDLIDTYINEPVRLDVTSRLEQHIYSVYEDRVLTYHDSMMNVYDIRGKLISQWGADGYTTSVLVSREEIVSGKVSSLKYTLYNFISGVRRDLELCEGIPPDGSAVVKIIPFDVAYYRGKLYKCRGIEFSSYRWCGGYSVLATIGKNPYPSGYFEYFTSELTFVRWTTHHVLTFCDHQVIVKCYSELLRGVLFTDKNDRWRYLSRDGAIKNIECDVSSPHKCYAYGKFMIIVVMRPMPAKPVISFARLRTT